MKKVQILARIHRIFVDGAEGSRTQQAGLIRKQFSRGVFNATSPKNDIKKTNEQKMVVVHLNPEKVDIPKPKFSMQARYKEEYLKRKNLR